MWQLELSMEKITEFFVVVSILPFFTSFLTDEDFFFFSKYEIHNRKFHRKLSCPGLE
jgi:hypothetical protein